MSILMWVQSTSNKISISVRPRLSAVLTLLEQNKRKYFRMTKPVKIRTARGIEVINLSARKAILARCQECSGFSHQDRINCKHSTCKLFPYRKGTGKNAESPTHRPTPTIRNYCKDCQNTIFNEVVRNCTDCFCSLYTFRAKLSRFKCD